MTLLCTTEGCTEPAAARIAGSDVSGPTVPGLGFAIVRPAASPAMVGDPLCLDHTHHAIDLMLLRALPGGPR